MTKVSDMSRRAVGSGDLEDFTQLRSEESPTVLVVDDEQGILETYELYLAPKRDEDLVKSARRRGPHHPSSGGDADYQLLLASTGEEAVQLVEEVVKNNGHVQVGFFDMKMPGGIDGLETMKRIREIDPWIYCVIVTAYQDRSLDEIGKVFGPEAVDQWEYLNKPFTVNEIVQKTRNAVALWTRRRQHDELVRTMEESNRKFKQYFEKQLLNLALENRDLRDRAEALERKLENNLEE